MVNLYLRCRVCFGDNENVMKFIAVMVLGELMLIYFGLIIKICMLKLWEPQLKNRDGIFNLYLVVGRKGNT